MLKNHFFLMKNSGAFSLLCLFFLICAVIFSLGAVPVAAQGNPFGAGAPDMFGTPATPDVGNTMGRVNDTMDDINDPRVTREEFELMSAQEQDQYLSEYGDSFRGADAPTYSLPTQDYNPIPAMKGRLVHDAYVNKSSPNLPLVLDDVQKIEIVEGELGNFSDDGSTLGDWVANDGIYSNIEPASTTDYIGATTFKGLSQTLNLLVVAQSTSVLELFGLQAVTTERFSRVADHRDMLSSRDGKIFRRDDSGQVFGWADTFLMNYRVDSSDIYSPFYPLYVPRPPEPPAIPAPPRPWRPPGYQPSRLERAIANYLKHLSQPESELGAGDMGEFGEMDGFEGIGTDGAERDRMDLDAAREELMIKLEDPDARGAFINRWAPEREEEEDDDDHEDDDFDD